MTEPTPEELNRAREISRLISSGCGCGISNTKCTVCVVKEAVADTLAERREQYQKEWSKELRYQEAFREGFEEGKARAYEAIGENGLVPMKRHVASLENLRERCSKIADNRSENHSFYDSPYEVGRIIAEEIRNVPLEKP